MATFTVSAAAVRAAQACQAVKDIRYYLNGILLAANGDVVGTNGHILARTKNRGAVYYCDNDGAPMDQIVRIDGTIPLSADRLKFNTDTQTVECWGPESKNKPAKRGKLFSYAVIDGTFPNYERVIPKLPRDNHSSGFAADPQYMALIGKVFSGNAPVAVYPGYEREAVLLCRDRTTMVLMPCMSHKFDFYALEVK